MAGDVLTRPDLTRPADAAAMPVMPARQHGWLRLPIQPFDLHGPVIRPYRRFDRSWIERPIFDGFLLVVDGAPDHIAADDGARQLTFRQVRDGACRLARAMADGGGAALPRGAPVGVLLPNDARYPVAVLACLAAGHPCVLLDANYPITRNAAIVADAGIAAVIIAEDGGPAPAGVASIPIGAAFDRAIDAAPPTRAGLAADAPALIVYTSGSTGQPKGIALAQRTFTHRTGQLIDALHLNADDRMMPLGSPCTVAGLLQMFEALLAGAMLIKVDLQRAGLGLVLDTIERTQATTMLATPALLRSLCRLADAPRKMASLRCVHAAGDVLLHVDVAELRAHLSPTCLLVVTYGATEAPAMGHWFVTDAAAANHGGGGRVPSGYPLPDYRYALIDDDGLPAAPGEPGELVVSSRYTALGEWQGGRVVAGRFAADPQDPAAHVLHTGDLVSIAPDGLITVLGRKDRLVKIRGMRVEPYEVECALRRSPEVADAAVVVRRSGEGNGDAALVAFVELCPPAAATGDAALQRLRAELRNSLPTYMQPARLHAIDRLPLLPGHKVDTAALLALDAARAPGGALSAAAPDRPATAAAQIAAAAWEQVLDRASYDADLPFDSAGGDSLSLLMLVSESERLTGVQLPLLDFDLAMRPSEMTQVLDRITGVGASGGRVNRAAAAPSAPPTSSSLVLLKPGSKKPAVFLMHGLGGYVAELAELVRHLRCDHPIYALQLPGLAAGDRPLDRIEDMAGRFAAALRDAEPQALYLLVGYSFGGLIAFELACQLEKGGGETRLLLLDAYPHQRFWPLSAWLGYLAERAAEHLGGIASDRQDRIPAAARAIAGSLIDHLRARRGLGPRSRIPRWQATDTGVLRRMRVGMMTARTRYRPNYYPRQIAFVQPTIRQPGAPARPIAAWRGRFGGLAVMRVPGDHLSMAMDHAGATAALVDRWVEEQPAA